MGAMKYLALFIFLVFLPTTISFDFYQDLRNFEIENNEGNNNNNYSACVADILLIFSTLAPANKTVDKEWALAMVDSSAKIPNGLLGGSLYHFGQFDECLGIVHPDGHLKGQHCMAEIPINITEGRAAKLKTLKHALRSQHMERALTLESFSMWYGICLPSTCSAAELNQIVAYFNTSIVKFDENNCWTDEPVELSDGSWAVTSLIIVLIAIALCSTLIELYQIHVAKIEKPQGLLISFSLYSNTISLFEIRDSGEMACLHGMRTISMFWIVLGHTFEAFPTYPLLNLIDTSKIVTDNSYILITNAFFAVDTFFVISGLLVAFVFFRNIGKNGSFDAPVSYIHRYFRLTPGLLMLLLINMTLMGDTTKGPLWGAQYGMAHMTKECESTWWMHILYVQNYVQPQADCLGQAWYLACDMQMFWISPLIMYPIYLWPKVGMALLTLLTIGFTMITFSFAYINEYTASLPMSVGEDQFNYDYVPTHTRIMPWLVGIALGVAICVIKAHKTKVRLSKTTVILGWTISAGICLGVLYGIIRFMGDEETSAAEAAAYLAFTRLGWAVGLAWVIFACIYGYGGWANSFLSAGIFQPLGKLSYNVFLIHKTVLSYRAATFRTTFYFDNLTALNEFAGLELISHLLAIVLYLLIDAPFGNLDRLLLRKIKILPYPAPKKPEKQINQEKVEVGEQNE